MKLSAARKTCTKIKKKLGISVPIYFRKNVVKNHECCAYYEIDYHRIIVDLNHIKYGPQKEIERIILHELAHTKILSPRSFRRFYYLFISWFFGKNSLDKPC